VSGDIDIRNYKGLLAHVFANVDFRQDLLFSHGPLDVLDHSSDNFSFGGKAGIDATIKQIEENSGRKKISTSDKPDISEIKANFLDTNIIKDYNLHLFEDNIPVLIISVNQSEDTDVIEKVKNMFRTNDSDGVFRLIIVVDHTVDVNDLFMVTWQLLGNTDPQRDHEFISSRSVLFDGTIKAYGKKKFPRKWPNIVCSDNETISSIDKKWESLGTGEFINSPSTRYIRLCRRGADEILID
jgi:4-hydroxy-3-polyprenylbenzoate decarboxylase